MTTQKKQSDSDVTIFRVKHHELNTKREKKHTPYIITTTLVLNRTKRQIQYTKLHVFVQFNKKAKDNKKKKRRLMKGQANCERPLCNFETNERREESATAGKERKKIKRPRHVDEHWRIAYSSSIRNIKYIVFFCLVCTMLCTNRGLDEVYLHKIA